MTRLRGIITNMHAKVPRKFNAKVELQETVHALVAGGHTLGEEGTESKKTATITDPSGTYHSGIQIYPFTT